MMGSWLETEDGSWIPPDHEVEVGGRDTGRQERGQERAQSLRGRRVARLAEIGGDYDVTSAEVTDYVDGAGERHHRPSQDGRQAGCGLWSVVHEPGEFYPSAEAGHCTELDVGGA